MEVKNFSKWLKRELKNSNKTCYQLAKETGLDHSNIIRLYNGKLNNPTWRFVTKVAKSLNKQILLK